MTFRKYDHLERMRHPEVDEIDAGNVYVFPKLDGTNASVWVRPVEHPELGVVVDIEHCAGSRNRQLSLENDNAGFCAWTLSDDETARRLRDFLVENPRFTVYGEWLVPHSLKTYREEAWRKFWIFDVYDQENDCYLRYEQYGEILRDGYGQNVIEPLCTIKNPSEEQLLAQVEANTYLIADGAGVGEGVVLKNYDWRNRFGRQPWAKIVRNAFKEQNRRAFGTDAVNGAKEVESEIAEHFVDPALVGKTRAKVVLDVANQKGITTEDPNFQHRVEAEFRKIVIPQLLGRVMHDLVNEEMWAILRKHKNPTINFKRLNTQVTRRVKELAQDLF